MKNWILFFSIMALHAAAFSQTIKEASLAIHGSSNAHDWETAAKDVRITGKFAGQGGNLTQIENLQVKVAVKQIKSEKGRTMDNKTHEALLGDKYPYITFNATKVTIAGNDITAVGPLTIAGKTQQATIKARWKKTGPNEVEIAGSYDTKMTTFGISPPTALLGTMKTTDPVTLKFSFKTNL